MSEIEVVPQTFTTDYTGGPGERTFFVQSRNDQATYTYLLEKQQVAALGEKLRELLILIDQSDPVLSATPARDPALALTPPLEPEWRIGTIGLSYQEDDDRIVVLVQPAEEPDEADAGPLEGETTSVRFLLRRDQVRSFILHALAIVAEGRETCPLCGLPMDPAGHICPASNGHRLTAL